MAAATPITNLEPTAPPPVLVDNTHTTVNYRIEQNGVARRKEDGGLIILED